MADCPPPLLLIFHYVSNRADKLQKVAIISKAQSLMHADREQRQALLDCERPVLSVAAHALQNSQSLRSSLTSFQMYNDSKVMRK